MTNDPSVHNGPPPKFDTLFADPRHYRADCRLLRTAVRRGWLNDAPQVDRDALADRFHKATEDRREADPNRQNMRALMAECWAVIEMVGADQRAQHRLLRYSWAGELPDRATGRPRERWHVTDCPGRIDAAEVRRQALASGMNLGSLSEVRVTVAAEGDAPRVHPVRVEARAGAVGGWRVFLCCPRCGHRRAYLFDKGTGIGCRDCLRVRYAVPER